MAVLDTIICPASTGLENWRRCRDVVKDHAINTVMLAQQKDEALFNRAISQGVKGYVLKKNAGNEILECIATVARGEPYVSSMLTDFLLRRRNSIESLGKRKPGLGQLTAAGMARSSKQPPAEKRPEKLPWNMASARARWTPIARIFVKNWD